VGLPLLVLADGTGLDVEVVVRVDDGLSLGRAAGTTVSEARMPLLDAGWSTRGGRAREGRL